VIRRVAFRKAIVAGMLGALGWDAVVRVELVVAGLFGFRRAARRLRSR